MVPLRNVRYPHTFAVIVTYGDRSMFLQQVVSRVFANGVGKISIVDNGASAASKQAIQRLERESNGRISVVALPENRGSAGGFKAGLEYARTCPDCEYMWLLDDDNKPAEGALAELFNQHAKLSQTVELDRLALVSLREVHDYYKKLARGVPPKKVFARKSSFMGFHFLDQPRKFSEFFHLNGVADKPACRKSPIAIPFAPYGGLFFHKSVVAKLGYPDEQFFLYCDDTEYTYRLTKGGGKLFLVPSSVVYDLQRPWHLRKDGATFFSHLLVADSDSRIYYVARNQSYLERHFWMNSLMTYTFNKWSFFVLLSFFALKHRKWKRVALIARAVAQGEAGELGRSRELDSAGKPY
jgi:GT2 family glycosyltransferase